MTSLSRCDLRTCSPTVLSPLAILGALVLAALVGGLAMEQINLRFCVRDFQIQTRKLQQARVELSSRKVALVADIERMRRYDGNFEDFARTQLGLSECPPDRKTTAVVPAESVERWQALALAADVPKRQALPRVVQIAEFVQHMLSWSTPILARDVDRREPVPAAAVQD
jgi:hypothetical protein